MHRRLAPLFAVIVLAAACDAGPTASVPEDLAEAPPAELLAAIDSAAVAEHIATLASDAFEGRAPGTPGEERAVQYIAEQMRTIGLEPAGDDGTFFQKVALLGARPMPQGPLVLRADDGAERRLEFVDDFIVSTDLDSARVAVEAPLVFVGYGIDAPAYDWDDYKGVDVTDKIVVMFVNDPIAGDDEPGLFQADTLTYFGRWTYKYEEARRQGAAGALLIHTIQTAGYPFTVLSGSAVGEQVALADPPENPLAVKAWITREHADALAQMAGSSLDEWFAAANDRAFEPRELPVTAALDVAYDIRRFDGTNVLGRVPGDALADEAVVYSAHHDHLGIGRPVAGDSIYNGAVDNATGVAMLLEIADAFVKQSPGPARTVLFASVTAEESGLLGAEYYAREPAVPLAQTVANINVDSGNVYGETDDIVGIGAERSDLRALLRDAAGDEGLVVTPDPQPNQGLFFRSDQLAFARGGVPGVFINTGRQFRGQPDDYFDRMSMDYRGSRYHQPGDEYDPSWPLGGLLQQARVAFRLGYRLANSRLTPAWREGEGFAAARAGS